MDSDPSALQADPSPAAVLAQLERILTSDDFAAAPRASRLLRYLVEETLAGRGGDLKEYSIGLAVFDRDASFDPASNPVVRVESSRLRQRLQRFYFAAGRDDPVEVDLARGGYVPAFRARSAPATLAPTMALDAVVRTGAPLGPSLLVLPFEFGADPSGRVFSDGLTYQIIADLQRFRDLRVLGRSTSLHHRSDRDVLELARRLRVDYVVEGTARRSASMVRAHAQVLSAADGRVLWSERYDRDVTLATLFDIESDIAGHVAAAIGSTQGTVLQPELTHAMRKSVATLDAFDALLVFYDYAANLSQPGHLRARAALESVVKVETESSSLWAALANLHADSDQLGFNVVESRAQHAERGIEGARHAIWLDPLNAASQMVLARSAFGVGDLATFRAAGERAVELNPNDPDILVRYGFYLTCLGDWDAGFALLDRARDLDPEPPNWYWFPFARWHFAQGEYREALAAVERGARPEFFWTHFLRAVIHVMLGDADRARAAAERLASEYPGFGREARRELGRWCTPEEIEPLLAAAAKAGLDPRSRPGKADSRPS